MTNKLFLKSDQEKADQALNEYDHYRMLEIEYTANAKFGSAAACLRNAANALDTLQYLENRKQSIDQARQNMRQIKQQEAIRGSRI
ncbi:hypothetical protein GCM10011409_21270 [Lentibacillus populi]|uniref:Uncharacterized protein n=1 Tax=Lentibacillus populi TaxID=1827502 RepID=A0A9W5X5W5_9BACI|nr:hypothetical protein [Lentibacillus populi]GGB43400.1 hypothetical protein GCM10011409_21270 [Lentibacillus populi]